VRDKHALRDEAVRAGRELAKSLRAEHVIDERGHAIIERVSYG